MTAAAHPVRRPPALRGVGAAPRHAHGGVRHPPSADPRSTDLFIGLAHDLRSPLSAILGLSEVLYHGQAGPLTEAQTRQIGLIHSAALGLCTMASDMLDLARHAEPATLDDPVAFAVRDVLDEVQALCGPMAAVRDLDLRFESCVGDERRLGHPRALSRVLLNLTTNALKYTTQGDVVVTARVQGPAQVAFSVRDTGSGLDAHARQDGGAFPGDPRASRRAHLSSAGLGLAMCHRLVRTMGAELRVVTRPGCGTHCSFELQLPPAARD